jgi:ABC-2 type transport system permease protein
MTIWRLEWLRAVRTRRLVAILGVYVFFGLTGPFTARYINDILARVGSGDVRIEAPPPTPADGIGQFVGNASQIGLLVVVLIATSALAFDARREMAVFLRTRVDSVASIVVPAYAVNVGVAVGGLVAGSAAAWYETTVLLGAVPVLPMLAGIALGAVFLAFAIAVAAVAAAVAKSVISAAASALIVLLGLALVGNITGVGRWLPTTLVGAMPALVRGASLGDYLPAAAIAAALTVAALAAAIGIGGRREL